MIHISCQFCCFCMVLVCQEEGRALLMDHGYESVQLLSEGAFGTTFWATAGPCVST